MEKKNISLKVGGAYTLYTYSEISQSAHKVELTILNVFTEPVAISDSVEKRVAIGTARVRGVDTPISLQVKIDEDIIISGWDQMNIETSPSGICFMGDFEACFRLMLVNVNAFVKSYDHCFHKDRSMEEPALIFPLGKKF